MLSAVLRTQTAVTVSIEIIRAFVEMRHILSSTSLLSNRINDIEAKQLVYQNETNQKLEKIFQFIDGHIESNEKIFFNGQIFDAFSFLVSLVQKADADIILIDNYVNVDTLNILSKKNPGVNVKIITSKNSSLSKYDVVKFNLQYPSLEVWYSMDFHDRFIIIDHRKTYHIGASLKDAGRKCFAVSLWQDEKNTLDLLVRLDKSVVNLL